MATHLQVAQAKEQAAGSTISRRWNAALYQQAVALLDQPPASAKHRSLRRRHLEDVQPAARTVLSLVQTLGIAFLWWGEERFAERALLELKNAADYRDWGPAHFLNVAEMSHAFGIGYDWLYEWLTPADREFLARAIVEKGLKPGLKAFAEGDDWTRYGYGWNLNWNLVCNGGLLLAALAIADAQPEVAWRTISLTLPALAEGFRSFGPQGGWLEGPGYWCYAAAYATWVTSSLVTALPAFDTGLPQAPGFGETGDFLLYMRGPTNLLFNFADGEETHSGYPWLLWMAQRFCHPLHAWLELSKSHEPSAHDLLWFTSNQLSPEQAGKPLAFHFRQTEVATMRGSWNDPATSFLGIKGGDNGASHHCHLDLGSFVLDSGGQRFVHDLGEDSYDLPGYFDRTLRFRYYRTATIGHNTLLINGENQNPLAKARITNFLTTSNWTSLSIDLDDAYRGEFGACRIQRTAALVDGRHVLISDRIRPNTSIDMKWQIHTKATVKLAGRQATLTLNNQRLCLHILEPAGVYFQLQSAEVPPPQNPNTGVSKLIVEIRGLVADIQLAVAFTPDCHTRSANVLSAALRRLASINR